MKFFFTFVGLLKSSWAKVVFKGHFLSKNQRGRNSVIIIGNGPSLAMDIDFIVSKKSNLFSYMCVNEFASTDYFSVLKPNYYLLLDSVYWGDEISNRLLILQEKTINDIVSKTKWNLILFVPFSANNYYSFMDKISSNKNIKIHFFNNNSYSFSFFNMFLYKNNLAMPTCQNVLSACLYVCLTLGYSLNLLIGADHSWHENIIVNDDNQLLLQDVHFYNQKSEYKVWSDGANEKTNKSVSEIFSILGMVFADYQILGLYSKYLKSKIYNVSARSYIDAFDKKNISDFF